MRAAQQAHVYSDRRTSATVLLRQLALAVGATVLLLVLWRPTVLRAQSGPPTTTAPKTPLKGASASAPVRNVVKPAAPRDTTTTTHVVKTGETLWSIASRYYGDGHEWRALARRNGIPTAGELTMKAGTKLQVPSKGAVAAVAAATHALPAALDTMVPKIAMTPAVAAPPPPPESVVVPRHEAGALSAQTADKTDAAKSGASRASSATKKVAIATPADKRTMVAASVEAVADTSSLQRRTVLMPHIKAERMLTRSPTHVGITSASAQRDAASRTDVPTVFVSRAPDAETVKAASRSAMARFTVAPRTAEYLAAPYPVESAQLHNAGRIVRRIEPLGASLHDVERMQLADEEEVAAPVGVTLTVGDRLVAVTGGTTIAQGLQMAIASGVLQVVRADAGKPVIAAVRSQSGAIERGQLLVPVTGTPASAKAAEPIKGFDVETRVAWVDSTALMPTLQSYVLLAAGDGQGVKAGDEFALVRKVSGRADEHVGVVRVVRTSARGSSAMVIRQSSADIEIGITARRIARMP